MWIENSRKFSSFRGELKLWCNFILFFVLLMKYRFRVVYIIFRLGYWILKVGYKKGDINVYKVKVGRVE